MGLLDDAIREHLELKRRRGADPDEVARQEDEALGDPRSGEFARPARARRRRRRPSAAEPRPEPDAGAATSAEPRGPAADERGRAGPRTAPASPSRTSAHEPEPRAAPAARDDEPVARGRARLERRRPADAPSSRRPTVEPEPEVVRPDDEQDGDEDVLEETPDFLQETPEHDRLWFEQKPPARLRLRQLGPRRLPPRRYTLLDVFTSTRLQGNPLAVVHDADGVPRRRRCTRSRARRGCRRRPSCSRRPAPAPTTATASG